MAKPILFSKRDTPGQKRIVTENLIAVWYTYENKLKNYFDNVGVEVYMKVKLEVEIDAIEMADDNYTYFLDLETGESVFLADELITGLDNEGLEEEIEENYGTRYLRLPTKFDIHEYHIMEEFIWTLEDEGANKLECAIQGRGAFRSLKIWLIEWEFYSNGMIFRQSIIVSWQLNGVRIITWSIRGQEYNIKTAG